MSKRASYAQKTSIFYRIWKANTDVSISSIQNRYKGTKYSMRRQDIADILRSFKNTDNYNEAKNSTRHSRFNNSKRLNYSDTDKVYRAFTSVYYTNPPHAIIDLTDQLSFVIEDFEYRIKNTKHTKAQIQLIFECEIDDAKRTVSTTTVSTDFYSRAAVFEQLEAAIFKITQSVGDTKFNWIQGAFHVWK